MNASTLLSFVSESQPEPASLPVTDALLLSPVPAAVLRSPVPAAALLSPVPTVTPVLEPLPEFAPPSATDTYKCANCPLLGATDDLYGHSIYHHIVITCPRCAGQITGLTALNEHSKFCVFFLA